MSASSAARSGRGGARGAGRAHHRRDRRPRRVADDRAETSGVAFISARCSPPPTRSRSSPCSSGSARRPGSRRSSTPRACSTTAPASCCSRSRSGLRQPVTSVERHRLVRGRRRREHGDRRSSPGSSRNGRCAARTTPSSRSRSRSSPRTARTSSPTGSRVRDHRHGRRRARAGQRGGERASRADARGARHGVGVHRVRADRADVPARRVRDQPGAAVDALPVIGAGYVAITVARALVVYGLIGGGRALPRAATAARLPAT